MITISVPLSIQIKKDLDNLIKSGYGSSKADVVRCAIIRLAEEEAIRVVLEAQKEPCLSGDLRELAKKIK